MIKFLIKGKDPALRWDCQFNEVMEFENKEEAIAYCKELFGDDDFILLEVVE